MSIVSTNQDLFSSLGLASEQASTRGTNNANELGLNTFLKLMITQLNNQDPFKPMENGEFLSQIAQFGSVSGLEQLNQNFEELAASLTSGQALQAGTVVGREVLAPIDAGHLTPGGSVRGRVQLEKDSPEVTLRVSDPYGQLVRELPLGAAPAGQLDFSWDGLDNAGSYATPGVYRMEVSAVIDDRPVTLQTKMFARVESVNLNGREGLTVNLEGLGPMAFSNVQQIY